MGSGRVVLVLAAAALVVASRDARAAETWLSPPRGLLRTGNHFLLGLGYLDFEPAPATTVAPGEWEARLELGVSNTFVRSRTLKVGLDQREERAPVDVDFLRRVKEREMVLTDRLFLVDGEVRRTAVRLRRGLAQGLEVEVTLPYLDVGGGRMDSLIDGFHSVFGFDHNGRQSVDRNVVLTVFELEEDVFRFDRPQASGLGDVRLSLRRGLAPATGPDRMVVETTLKLPTGDADGPLGSGSLDAAVQALAIECRGRGCGHLGAGATYLGASDFLGLSDQLVYAAVVGLEWRFGTGLSGVAQLIWAESPLRALDLDELDLDAYRVSLGVRRAIGSRYRFEAALTENFVHFENGADLELQLGVSRSLGGASRFRR